MWLRLVILAVIALSASARGTEEKLSRVRRVVNGTELSEHGTWPFIVIVEKRCVQTGDIPFRCGGTILGQDRVITNKQCV